MKPSRSRTVPVSGSFWRHAGIATIQIYTQVLDERLKSTVRDLHPLAET